MILKIDPSKYKCQARIKEANPETIPIRISILRQPVEPFFIRNRIKAGIVMNTIKPT
jgi:hypothetical protein